MSDMPTPDAPKLDWLIAVVPDVQVVPQACARLNREGCEVKFVFQAFTAGLKMPAYAVLGCREARMTEAKES